MIGLFALMIAVQGASTQAVDADAERRNQVLCRQRPVTGSRLRFTRVCMTRQEWDERRENMTRGMRDFTTREMTSMPPPRITPGSE
jgi:hypothetical protein